MEILFAKVAAFISNSCNYFLQLQLEAPSPMYTNGSDQLRVVDVGGQSKSGKTQRGRRTQLESAALLISINGCPHMNAESARKLGVGSVLVVVHL